MAELEQMHTCHHKQRLANFILIHASPDAALYMAQQQVAQHLGTTREVIARLLGEFVAQRLVATQRGMIKILDVDHLRTVATAFKS